MTSVTQRIAQYNKQVGQPRGGLLPPKLFSLELRGDDLGVVDHKQENLHASVVGTMVDVLTRLAHVRPPADEVAHAEALIDVFGVSLAGAMRISELTEYTSAQSDARDALRHLNFIELSDGTVQFVIDDTAVMIACQLVSYDVALRAGVGLYDPANSRLLPDLTTTTHVLQMVERARSFFETHGPITRDGFVFADRDKWDTGDLGGYTDLVTSGDGDFLTTDTLWDFKVSASKPTKDHTLQVLMYFLMGKQSGLPEFESLTHIGLFNPRRGEVYRMAVANISAVVIETVRRDVIGYEDRTSGDEPLTPYDFDPEAVGFDRASGEFLWGNGD